jgi:hypothetical protein
MVELNGARLRYREHQLLERLLAFLLFDRVGKRIPRSDLNESRLID